MNLEQQSIARTIRSPRVKKSKKTAIANPDDILIAGDRVRPTANWDLRDEQREQEAYDLAVDALTDRDDFDVVDVEALQQELRLRFGPRRDEHALAPDQMTRIAEAHNLEAEAVSRLSRQLAIVLDPEKTRIVVRVPRTTAVNRAKVALEAVRSQIMSSSDLLLQAYDTIVSLDTAEDCPPDSARKFEYMRNELKDVLDRIEVLHRKFTWFAGRRDEVLDLRPGHKRDVSDERRIKVLFCIFEFWAACGRPLTTTTDPGTGSSRKGPLYDFVNDIVACVTDPPVALSGHTIFDDLKAYKASIGMMRSSTGNR